MDMTKTINLADCLEFRQTLQARPPRVVHGAVLLLVVLMVAAGIWMTFTKADLVVRGVGRIRPVSTPSIVRVEASGNSAGFTVVEVRFRPGEEVHKGDVLIRLDTQQLENEISKAQKTIFAGESDVKKEADLLELLDRQFEAAAAKAEAELTRAQQEVKRAKDKQASEIRQATNEKRTAELELSRQRWLYGKGATSRADLEKAEAAANDAREKLTQASLPVDEGQVEILKKAAAAAKKDNAIKRQESEMRRENKNAEVEKAQKDLANLELQKEKSLVRATTDGVVTRGDVKVGDTLAAGKEVVEIAQRKGFVFEMAVTSEDLTHLKVGLPAKIRLDAFDHQKYGTLHGEVTFIAPDSEVRDGQGAPTYLVKIRVGDEVLGPAGDRGDVQFGMTGQVDIVTGDDTILMLLAKKVRQTISLK
jgi:multidrug resistance efflux pump